MQEACSDTPTLRRSVADVGHGFSPGKPSEFKGAAPSKSPCQEDLSCPVISTTIIWLGSTPKILTL
jgi:hypothetical protein